MSGLRFVWLILIVVVAMLAPSAIAAQDADSVPESLDPTLSVDLDQGADVDGQLQDDLDTLAGRGETYDAEERRDPFRSLLAGRRTAPPGERPEGIPGLLIDELDLTGIYVTPEGPVAQVRAADKRKSYLLREGDQLFDGDVLEISKRELMFKQIVDDPAALKPFREVVKKLNPRPGKKSR